MECAIIEAVMSMHPFSSALIGRFLSCITIQSALEEGETIDNVPILSMARLMPGGVDNIIEM